MIAEISRRNINLVDDIITMESLDTADVEVKKERMELVWEVNEVMNVYPNSQLRAEKRFAFTHSHDRIYAEVDSMKYLQIVDDLVSKQGKCRQQILCGNSFRSLISAQFKILSNLFLNFFAGKQPGLFCDINIYCITVNCIVTRKIKAFC